MSGLKVKIVEKLKDNFNVEKIHAELMYDLFVDTIIQCWTEDNSLFIEKLGRLNYHKDKQRWEPRVKFHIADFARCKMAGIDFEEFSQRKHAHKTSKKDITSND